MILTLALTPFVLALFVTLVLRATVRNGTVWAIGVGVVLAVGLFVAFHYFSYHCESSGDSGCDGGDIGDLSSLDYQLPFLGFVLWLLGVGAGAGVSRLSHSLAGRAGVALASEREETRGASASEEALPHPDGSGDLDGVGDS